MNKSVSVVLAGLLAGLPAMGGNPSLSPAEVIRMGNGAAKSKGYDLSKYGAPDVKYEAVRKDDTWWALYEGKEKKPGNHFAVRIQDKSREVEVVAGR